MMLVADFFSPSLATGLLGDALGAASTAALVAPASAILDKGITQSAAGAASLSQSVIASLRSVAAAPFTFFQSPQYGWLFALYFATYMSANAAETVCAAADVDHAVPQLAVSTATNMVVSIAKDRSFARAFGTINPTNLPPVSYGYWLTRDTLSMYFFFTLPRLASGALPDFAASAARFISPVVAQFFTTPFHLLGLDAYNRQRASLFGRLAFVRSKFPAAVSARVGRIIPAYSFGGVCNATIRSRFSDTE